jgi:hypothetical protein
MALVLVMVFKIIAIQMETNDSIQRYGTFLVEVSTGTATGRLQIRRCECTKTGIWSRTTSSKYRYDATDDVHKTILREEGQFMCGRCIGHVHGSATTNIIYM